MKPIRAWRWAMAAVICSAAALPVLGADTAPAARPQCERLTSAAQPPVAPDSPGDDTAIAQAVIDPVSGYAKLRKKSAAADAGRPSTGYAAWRKFWQADITPLPAGARPPCPPAATDRRSGYPRVGIQIRNSDIYLNQDLGFHVLQLDGWLEPKRADMPVDFDAPDTYDLRIESGEIMVPFEVLATLFNRYILTYPGARFTDVKTSYYTAKQLMITGRANPWGLLPHPSVPVTMIADIATIDDRPVLRLTPQQTQAFGLPLTTMMHLTGIGLASVVPITAAGVDFKGNTLDIDYQALFPPPKIVGNASAAWVGARGLYLRFGKQGETAMTFAPPGTLPQSYIWLQSGDVKFFNLTLLNARALIRPAPLTRTFRFALNDYRQRLASGDATIAPDGTLEIALPPN
ncbi:hypothetical protein WS67_20865 [Burkholderia singularis]|uniref:DUF2993 domain-containing protein n=1 Tax=Burkholderia singularis TaxID=1503053 RepID=A0A118DM88_9BURK|nr:hypothetical protein [Burkholderia singularis]KVE24549.1 hypothetical protein WS67_20865 [Burkholderia singularis]